MESFTPRKASGQRRAYVVLPINKLGPQTLTAVRVLIVRDP
ncbi:hypothetical protein GGD54_005728 [Rhizobium tropici]|uniref:Uncharacterized protein n=1 Tax=Rhizobium tropici TaxID=398 RepID=A0ABR6R7Z8_RHITR|nr:hypothetical protein [Rhizobium tropici]MBB5595837.1 hypothetical protein [Rhizobium tropici]MBB6495314.1 hypothetical protein [Rhizobium tropici]